jgi:acetyl esterase
MITDFFRILSPLFKPGRLKGIDPLLHSLIVLGGATKNAAYYADTSAERERKRTMNALSIVRRLRKKENGKRAPVATTDMHIPGHYGDINLKLYSVPDPEELILFFHGGGWVVGSIATADHLCEGLAGGLNAAVVSVDYHLAPEYRFPAGLEDAVSAIEWGINMAPSLGIPPEKVTVCGTSSGANLAAAACLQRRDNHLALPARQLLIYPVTDITTFDTESYRKYGKKKVGLSPAQMNWFISNYVTGDVTGTEPYISINRAEDLSSLPPALIVTAEFDILRSEAEAFASRLTAAGTKTEIVKAAGMLHGFLNFIDIIDSATLWFDRILKAYRRFRDVM